MTDVDTLDPRLRDALAQPDLRLDRPVHEVVGRGRRLRRHHRARLGLAASTVLLAAATPFALDVTPDSATDGTPAALPPPSPALAIGDADLADVQRVCAQEAQRQGGVAAALASRPPDAARGFGFGALAVYLGEGEYAVCSAWHDSRGWSASPNGLSVVALPTPDHSRAVIQAGRSGMSRDGEWPRSSETLHVGWVREDVARVTLANVDTEFEARVIGDNYVGWGPPSRHIQKPNGQTISRDTWFTAYAYDAEGNRLGVG